MTRTVITGGPGSGKTTLAADLAGQQLELLGNGRPPGMLVCAPTTAGVRAVASRLADRRPAGSQVRVGTVRDLASCGTRPLSAPWLLVVDQLEDCVPSELDLVATWARNAAATVAAVDVDQQITGWAGASPASVSAFVHAADRLVALDRSHRVPAAVADLADRWVAGLPNPHRAALFPADRAGRVHRTAVSVHDPMLVDRLAADLDRGRTVLVAALSGALLGPLVANVRAAGVPCRDLTADTPDPQVVEALARYLALDEREQPATARAWTGADVRAWWPLCRAPRGGLRAEARHIVGALPADRPVPFELLADLWGDDRIRARALDPDPGWLLDAAKPGYRRRLAHLVAVAERNGHAELARPPRLLVGTVHSAKHVEVDVVYLAPDLTPGQADEWWGGRRDRLTRLAYVAATRARLEVAGLARATRYALPDSLFQTQGASTT